MISVLSMLSIFTNEKCVSEFPHQFVQKLPNQLDITERDNLELEVMTGEEDADVKWFKDGHEVVLERKRKQT